jgi:hypothetical protein
MAARTSNTSCPDCGLIRTAGAIAVHRRKKHGIEVAV